MIIELFIVSGIDIGWIEVEALGMISGNWTVVDEILIGICFSILLFTADDIVIERVIVGGFKRDV